MEFGSYTWGIAIILASIIASIIGLLIVRKCLDKATLAQCHDVSGNLLAVVGTMYAVLLGLVVVDAMSKFQECKMVVANEANAVADIFLLSEQFPEKKRTEVQLLCKDYAERVINDEWPLMDQGKHCPEARRAALRLVKASLNFEPVTQREQASYGVMVTSACEFWNARRQRIITASSQIPIPEWVVLIAGGVITVIFTYFFVLENVGLQILMTSMVSATLALNVYLVCLFGYPFNGDVCVDKGSFELIKTVFENRVGYHHDSQLNDLGL